MKTVRSGRKRQEKIKEYKTKDTSIKMRKKRKQAVEEHEEDKEEIK